MALNLNPRTNVGGEAAGHGGTQVVSAQPPPPEAIAPHFPQLEILECLGRGGMGIVYRARQIRLNRVVALKILAPERKHAPGFAERFAREAQALARLNHPNIVTIHDFGEAGGLYFLLMEFVNGGSLRRLLQTRQITPGAALAIIPQLCEALQFAHAQGVVHRDIKPENILVNPQGRVKIADFGIAKLLERDSREQRTLDQQVVGTPHYMAPEQVEQPESVDHRADIYSLGVVFYEMLTGELPLGKFSPPSHQTGVDVRLDEVVLRTLEKVPERRYQNIGDVKTAVETIARTSTKPQPELPGQKPSRKPAGSDSSGMYAWHWWLVGAAGVILVGMLMLGMFLLSPPTTRWRYEKPYVVAGKVTDAQGRGIAGARILVVGRESRTAQKQAFTATTNTDASGAYLLPFGPWPASGTGGASTSKPPVALVMAEKEGYYETTLREQGFLTVSDTFPRKGSKPPSPGMLQSNRVCTLNFVLQPAARIEGLLVDEEEQPLRNQMICLNGPKHGKGLVYATKHTDREGRFTIEAVPPQMEWWLQLGAGNMPGSRCRSAPLKIESAKSHKLHVKRAGPETLETSLQYEMLEDSEEVVSDPAEAIRAVLPRGWAILRDHSPAHPFYRPPGNGREIVIGDPRTQTDGKPVMNIFIWLMPADYQDGGADPTHGRAQTSAPRLIAVTRKGKLYIWGSEDALSFEAIRKALMGPAGASGAKEK